MLILKSVALGQQPSMEVPNTSLIVMVGGTPFEGHEPNRHIRAQRCSCKVMGDRRFIAAWMYKMELALPPRDLNALPPESTRIHGPRTRSEHRQ